MATCELFATASRSASVRCAVSSVTSRSGKGLTTSSSSSSGSVWPPMVMTARCTVRSEEHTSELQSLMRISYAVFCLKKKNKNVYLQTYKYKTLSQINEREVYNRSIIAKQ